MYKWKSAYKSSKGIGKKAPFLGLPNLYENAPFIRGIDPNAQNYKQGCTIHAIFIGSNKFKPC